MISILLCVNILAYLPQLINAQSNYTTGYISKALYSSQPCSGLPSFTYNEYYGSCEPYSSSYRIKLLNPATCEYQTQLYSDPTCSTKTGNADTTPTGAIGFCSNGVLKSSLCGASFVQAPLPAFEIRVYRYSNCSNLVQVLSVSASACLNLLQFKEKPYSIKVINGLYSFYNTSIKCRGTSRNITFTSGPGNCYLSPDVTGLTTNMYYVKINAATTGPSLPTSTPVETPSLSPTKTASPSREPTLGVSASPSKLVTYVSGYVSKGIYSTSDCTGTPYFSFNTYMGACTGSGNSYSMTLIDPVLCGSKTQQFSDDACMKSVGDALISKPSFVAGDCAKGLVNKCGATVLATPQPSIILNMYRDSDCTSLTSAYSVLSDTCNSLLPLAGSSQSLKVTMDGTYASYNTSTACTGTNLKILFKMGNCMPYNKIFIKFSVATTTAGSPVGQPTTAAVPTATPVSKASPVTVTYKSVLALAGVTCTALSGDSKSQEAIIKTMQDLASKKLGYPVTVKYDGCSRRRRLLQGLLADSASVSMKTTFQTTSTDPTADATSAQSSLSESVTSGDFVTSLKANAVTAGATIISTVTITSVASDAPVVTTFTPTIQPTRNPASSAAKNVKGFMMTCGFAAGMMYLFL